MKKMWQESFVPVLAVFALLWGALVVLRSMAESHSRVPAVVHIAADEVPASMVRDDLWAGTEGSWTTKGRDSDTAPRLRTAAAEERDETDFAALQAGQGPNGELQRAVQLMAQDSLGAALAEVASVLQANPHHSGAWFLRAGILSRSRQRQEAIAAYERCAQLASGRAKAIPLYNLGCLQRVTGHPVEAATAFRRALERRPDYREARLNLAILLTEQGRQAEALRLYDQLLRLAPDYSEAWYNRGVLALTAGRVDSARADFEKTVQLDSTFAKAWFNLGLVYGRGGRTSEAERAYRRALAANPAHLQSRLNLAILLAALPEGRGEAKRLYDEILRQAPDYALAYYNRGVLALQVEDIEGAQADFERTAALDPQLTKAWFNLGLLHARARRHEEAARAYRNAVGADPTHLRAQLNLAVSLTRLERFEAAAAVYRDLLARDPSYASAWYNLGRVLSRVQDGSGAERAYRQVLELEPDNAQAWLSLGVVHSRRKRGREAIHCYEEALAIRPENTAARYNLALEYRRRGDIEKAITEATRLLRLDPEHEKAQRFLANTRARPQSRPEFENDADTAKEVGLLRESKEEER